MQRSFEIILIALVCSSKITIYEETLIWFQIFPFNKYHCFEISQSNTNDFHSYMVAKNSYPILMILKLVYFTR